MPRQGVLPPEARERFDAAQTIVVKVGSNILTDAKHGARKSSIRNLVAGIASFKKQGKNVILVSSGAVGCGRTMTNTGTKTIAMPQKQALSAIGQIKLMHLYSEAFAKQGIIASQVLLTINSLKDRNQYHNLTNCLSSLFEFGAVPIINENDTLATEELSIGDNDTIAALISTRIGADLLILLTAVDGLLDVEGKTITELKKINTREYNFKANGTKSTFGTGGMESKLQAAKLAVTNGTPVIIANGERNSILEKIAHGKAKGTFIHPRGTKLKGHKSWILAATSEQRGFVYVDGGAATALTSGGKSLLPAGVTEVIGSFAAGEVIKVLAIGGECIAVGITNFSSEDAQKVSGKHSGQISKLLGNDLYEELIHRDNLVIIDR